MGDFLLPQTAQPGDRDATRRLSAPIHSERHVRVICVGAGASGLLMAYKLQKHFHNYSLVCYEKNQAVSGTWFENRYPGFGNSHHRLLTYQLTLDVPQLCLRCTFAQLHLEFRA